MDFANYWFDTSGGAGGVIGASLRFRGTQWLFRANPNDRHTQFTYSGWVKRTNVNKIGFILNASLQNDSGDAIRFVNDGTLRVNQTVNGSHTMQVHSLGLHRDPAAWYHIVVQYDALNSDSAQRVRLYVNGVDLTDTVQAMSNSSWWYGGYDMYIGRHWTYSASETFEGYMAELHWVTGSVVSPNEFGEFDEDSGTWKPKVYAGTHGSSGWYLDFSDPNDIGADRSGNGQNFTPNGFELNDPSSPNYDWVADSPDHNFAVLTTTYPSVSSSVVTNAGLTSSNAGAKPTILGVPKPDYGWDGTEAGWNRTGDVDFGQRTSGDPVSTAELPETLVTNPKDYFEAYWEADEETAYNKALADHPNALIFTTSATNDGGRMHVQSPWTTLMNMGNFYAYIGWPATPSYSSNPSLAWAFDYGTSTTTTNNDGNVTSQVIARPEAGMSYVGFVANGTSGQLVGHGLNKKPSFMMVFTSPTSQPQMALASHIDFSNPSSYRRMDYTGGDAPVDAEMFNNNANTDKVIQFGNKFSGQIHAFVFAEAPGFSHFQSYTANGSTDGPFLNTGFKPGLSIFLAENRWGACRYFDYASSPINPTTNCLFVGSEAVFFEPNTWIDIHSNGVKHNHNRYPNASNGQHHVYAAFAQEPIGSNVQPPTAR